MQEHTLTHNIDALRYMLAGNATVTFKSQKTGDRRTFKIRKNKPSERFPNPEGFFVSFLNGPDNESDYLYLGMISGTLEFRLTNASRAGADSVVYKAFKYVWDKLQCTEDVPGVEIWHSGKCGRCGRTLTVPESIESGIGPECASKL